LFLPNSRYATAGTYSPRTSSGVRVTATRLPIRPRPTVQGVHRRTDFDRLDLIAARALGDPTAFWRLCDASGALAPDALAARDTVSVPAGGRVG
jgi:hypothetical protein